MDENPSCMIKHSMLFNKTHLELINDLPFTNRFNALTGVVTPVYGWNMISCASDRARCELKRLKIVLDPSHRTELAWLIDNMENDATILRIKLFRDEDTHYQRIQEACYIKGKMFSPSCLCIWDTHFNMVCFNNEGKIVFKKFSRMHESYQAKIWSYVMMLINNRLPWDDKTYRCLIKY